MGDRDGERVEAVADQLCIEIVRRGQLAERGLDRQFPGGGRADRDIRFGPGDGRAGGLAERGIVGQPPEQRVGVEEQPHGCSPLKAAATSGGSSSKSGAMVTRPSQPPGVRGAWDSTYGTSLATGVPDRPIRISSPCSARSTRREKFVFASWMFT